MNFCNHPICFMLSSTLHKISWQLGFIQSFPICPPVRWIWPRTFGTIQWLLCSPVRCTKYHNHLGSFNAYYISTSNMVTHFWNHSMPFIFSTLYKISQPLGILQSPIMLICWTWSCTLGTIQCFLSLVRCTRYCNHLRFFNPYYVSTSDMVTYSWNHSMLSISNTLYKILQPLGIL